MPMTMKFEGMEAISKLLTTLKDEAPRVASKALYEGAGIMADTISKQANAITTSPFHYAVFVQRDPSPEEKAIVSAKGAVGIAKFGKNGSEVDTKVGYGGSGYAMLKGRRKAIPQIANAINSGTSFMKKQPFFRKAVTAGSKPAEAKISEVLLAEYDKIIERNGGTST